MRRLVADKTKQLIRTHFLTYKSHHPSLASQSFFFSSYYSTSTSTTTFPSSMESSDSSHQLSLQTLNPKVSFLDFHFLFLIWKVLLIVWLVFWFIYFGGYCWSLCFFTGFLFFFIIVNGEFWFCAFFICVLVFTSSLSFLLCSIWLLGLVFSIMILWVYTFNYN